ncbi:MAG: lysophospholipase [Alphaproteobacteria bacterium]|nr:lysophospholipase [Alphaproteobacteria bacterium]
MKALVTDAFQHDGLTFVARGWPGETPARTALVIHHGLGEHGGRYETFARRLEGLPVDVWTYDARGHGESGGKRGHAMGLRQLASDFHHLLPRLRERAGAERVVVLGHSMGAATVATWATDPELPGPPDWVRAILLSAAPVSVPRTLEVRVKEALARVLARIRPSFTMGSGLSAEGISSDASEVRRYEDDPLVHDRISAALGLSVLRDAPRVVERADRIRLPTVMWHGTEDPIAAIVGSRDLFRSVGADDKLLHEFAGYRHECHHETPERVTAMFELVRDWLEPHLA